MQKYIENPLIIHKKKFDIRQWVLVTDWNPLTVWIYAKSYVRFAMMDYDPTNRVKYAHLTNNCLVKKYKKEHGNKAGGVPTKVNDSPEKFGDKANDFSSDSEGNDENDDAEEVLGNIWSVEDFSEHLNKEFKDKRPNVTDIYEEIIYK